MATDQASDSKLAKKLQSTDEETVRLDSERTSSKPRTKKPAKSTSKKSAVADSKAASAQPKKKKKKKKSVLEKVRPPKRTLKEYLSSREGRIAAITYLVSIVVHGMVLLALTLVILKPDLAENLFDITSTPVEKPIEEPEEVFDAVKQPNEIYNQAFEDEPDLTVAQDIVEETQPLNIDLSDLEPAIEIDEESLSALAELAKEGEFGGRTAKGRKSLVKASGGSDGSEASVVRALKWIADQQLPDGSWNFAAIGDSPNPGSLKNAPMGATGMALMAFLGAGHTHVKDGPYKKHVEKGLAYIMNNAKIQPTGVDYRDPITQGMYVQGICTIALTEAYGMTKDRRLRRPVEGGIAFIVNAQHPTNGGWRYKPGDAGDTSVVGWQVMALISAHHSNIKIPRNVFSGITAFLNNAQYDDGAQYSYLVNGGGHKNTSLTAVGLLCRMYLGWERDTASLKKGIAILAKTGPSKSNEYYNYYATQIMHHFGGEVWDAWNNVMRDQLVQTQSKKGPTTGSWKPGSGHGPEQGGRLYSTCLNVMTLEVYYRHLPLYQRNAVQADF
jgi:hypothetical protein